MSSYLRKACTCQSSSTSFVRTWRPSADQLPPKERTPSSTGLEPLPSLWMVIRFALE